MFLSTLWRDLRATAAGQCEVCRQWGRGALCAACIARHAAPLPRCARCGLRLGMAAPICGACLREPPPWERTVCCADYDHPWDALITAFKFHHRPELAGALGQRLAAAVRAADGPLPALVLPVPLSPRRLAERGYNQAWELARRVAKALQLPADATLLQRPVEQQAHQAELTRDARLRNLQGAFMVDPRRRALLDNQPVALVDDVMTTGATLQQAAQVLLRAGAASVQAWVVARTPDVH